MKSVIVTGADGFIGSHLCMELHKNNINVYALVLENSDTLFRIKGLDNVTIIECDYNNLLAYANEFSNEIDAFYHLAWAGVSPDDRNNENIQIKNLEISLEAVKLASKLKCKKFILPGSTSEYCYSGIIKENNVPTPQNIYGGTKIAVQYLCASLARKMELPFIYAICASTYSADRRDNNVIFYVIDKLLKEEYPKLTKLEQKWDYIHINDLIKAFVLIGEKGVGGKTYPIGSGDNCSLSEYIFKIRDIINPLLPLGIGEVPYQNEGVLPSSCLDTTILYQDTDFKAEVSFEDGIKEMIEVVKSKEN